MIASLFWLILWALLFVICLIVLGGLYFKWYLGWELRNRRGMNYYGRTFRERQAFKKKIKRQALLLRPVISVESWLRRATSNRLIPSIVYDGVYGPSFSCSRESFRKASAYSPTEKDIFVVTQMRSGTTWMQQVVFQVLTRGNGQYDDGRYRHLYAISPWLEGLDSVALEDAPGIGPGASRIIKTHMPARLCPDSERARYVYVMRHPVSCFASIMDYFELTAGPFAPPISDALAWYLSDRMWWLPWPDHVSGWWDRSRQKENVLFIQFEQMKENPRAIIQMVARFLGQKLNADEIQRAEAHSSFQYMKEKESYFEMIPPNMFSVSGTYLKSGKLDRHKRVDPQIRRDISLFCGQALEAGPFPLKAYYPDVSIS